MEKGKSEFIHESHHFRGEKIQNNRISIRKGLFQRPDSFRKSVKDRTFRVPEVWQRAWWEKGPSAHLSCIRDGLQLQRRQPAPIDDLLRDGQPVPNVRRVHAGQRAGLHHRIRVPQADLHCKQTPAFHHKANQLGVSGALWDHKHSTTKVLQRHMSDVSSNAYISWACTLHTSLHGRVHLPLPPRVLPLLSSQELSAAETQTAGVKRSAHAVSGSLETETYHRVDEVGKFSFIFDPDPGSIFDQNLFLDSVVRFPWNTNRRSQAV